jgi:hypothetical protein
MDTFGLRREAKRHAALASEPCDVQAVPICGAKAVSSLRFATAEDSCAFVKFVGLHRLLPATPLW